MRTPRQYRNFGALLAIGIAVCVPLGTPAAFAQEGGLTTVVAERCQGHGALQSFSLTTWEGGLLGAWSAGTHDVAKQGTFDTPDWEVVGSLPNARAGEAAFVPDLEIGNCTTDDESGVLNLDSPTIVIPAGVLVPRISVDHWFQTEFGFDGGNFKISVNGGPFNLIAAAAIEVVPYNDTLFPAVDEFEIELNSNPLADQDAYTGTLDDLPGGTWVQSRINLRGIAAAGDSVRLRFDFGVDGCTLVGQTPAPVGWYVDEVEFYRCEAELLPSDCGNGLLNAGEQCDDGNDFIEDGCSNTCQVEAGWECTEPDPPGDVADPSFEAGRPNPFWDEVSNNILGSPICDVATCGKGEGTGPSDGTFWAWLGGAPSSDGSVSQSVMIPATATELVFDLEIPRCGTVTDFVEVLIDANPVWMANASSPLCDQVGYTQQHVDIGAFADGGTHQLEFHGETAAVGFSNFFVDRIAIPGTPSICSQEGATSLTLVKQVTNDDGGTALPSAWTLSATGPTPFSGPGPTVSSGGSFAAGTYDLAESGGPAGYAASAWVCVGGTQNDANTITLALGEAATCTITNNDLSAGDVIFEDGFESDP